ncbi:hypothetical protein O3P69_004325 [Scylla paramamosain]|uniref:Uncharacterized protein n=1 Tax=Scylla paramamosain TaxID=85552 RepID=A0AAW0UDT6_SCYPA
MSTHLHNSTEKESDPGLPQVATLLTTVLSCHKSPHGTVSCARCGWAVSGAGCGGLSQVLVVVRLPQVLAVVGLSQIEELTIKYELGKRRTHESDSQSNSMTQGIADFPVDLSHLDDGVPVGDGQRVSLKYP